MASSSLAEILEDKGPLLISGSLLQRLRDTIACLRPQKMMQCIRTIGDGAAIEDLLLKIADTALVRTEVVRHS